MKIPSFLTTLTCAAVVQAGKSPAQTKPVPTVAPGCLLTGNYTEGTNVSTCSHILIDSLNVPAGVQLNLTEVQDNATITFKGTTTFGTQLWAGPLIYLKGNNLTVHGDGTLDGQGAWYWPYGQKVTRPVFFRMWLVNNSTLSGFHIKNVPYRTFSILNVNYTTIDGLTLDSRAGDNLAKNTDGFDLSRNDHVTIKNCKVWNQDDCLAMQSSKDTFFINNYCHGGHGISIGSLGGDTVSDADTVDGLTVHGNQIVNNTNGIRIKTIINLVGLIKNVKYTKNVLNNVENAIVVHSDYNKTQGGYSGQATSKVLIEDITINGLTGTATNLYDIFVNNNVSKNWTFKGIQVKATSLGNCTNQPTNIKCT